MRRRHLQRAFFGFAVVTIAFGCTTISGVDKYDVDRATPVPDSNTAFTDASTVPPGSPDTGSPIDADAGSDDGAPHDAAAPSRRVFITSATFNGSLGGLTGADAQCRGAATAAGLGTSEWRAWLSTSSVNAIARLPYAGAYVLVDGTLVSRDATELASGTLQHPINVDEYGSVAGTDGGSAVVWTATDEHGQGKPSYCVNWTSPSYWDWGGSASAASINADWTNGGGRRCSEGAHLYCFEQ